MPGRGAGVALDGEEPFGTEVVPDDASVVSPLLLVPVPVRPPVLAPLAPGSTEPSDEVTPRPSPTAGWPVELTWTVLPHAVTRESRTAAVTWRRSGAESIRSR